jgi:hypothetical protein
MPFPFGTGAHLQSNDLIALDGKDIEIKNLSRVAAFTH